MYKFSKKSLLKMQGLKAELVYLLSYSITTSPIDFSVIEGKRSTERQQQLFKDGKSQLDGINERSNHQPSLDLESDELVATAFDIIPYPLLGDWDSITNKARFKKLSDHIKKCAEEVDTPIIWGGDWETLVDMPHYEHAE